VTKIAGLLEVARGSVVVAWNAKPIRENGPKVVARRAVWCRTRRLEEVESALGVLLYSRSSGEHQSQFSARVDGSLIAGWPKMLNRASGISLQVHGVGQKESQRDAPKKFSAWAWLGQHCMSALLVTPNSNSGDVLYRQVDASGGRTLITSRLEEGHGAWRLAWNAFASPVQLTKIAARQR
jgi:hypothetical protein